MVAALLISLREGLEASLIISIVFGYLRKTGQMRYQAYAWAGVVAAILVSIMVALGIQAVGAELVGQAEQLFEGTMMLLAVAVLTWMIFWMRYQARTLKGNLETELELTFQQSSPRGLFAVTFFAVVREGIETALLLSATAFMTNGADTVLGTTLGLVMAAVIGVMLYASVVRLNLSSFFNVTSLLLLFFAAGLFSNSIHEFQEASVLPTLVEHVWDTSALLSDSSGVGEVLRTLFGYSSSPSLVEILGYLGYWVFALVGMPWLIERRLNHTTTMSLNPTTDAA